MPRKKPIIVIPADPNDEEDFDVTQEGLDRAYAARKVRQARNHTGLTQKAFAQKFHIPLGTLRDWEQARVSPPPFALAYITLILSDPDIVAKSYEL